MATTTFRKFRVDDDLWQRFGAATASAPDPEADMSKVLRQFLRWYVGESGARLPERPTPVRDLGVLNPGDTVHAQPGELTTWSE